MDEVEKILSSDIENVNKRIKKELKSSVFLLDTATFFMLKGKGKQLRPKLTYAISRMIAQEPNDRTEIGASMVELLHTATLIHDDVVDDADKRRGKWSLPSVWKNKASVLVGDYIMSKGLLIALENQQYDILQELSNAVKSMSEGELLQLEKTKRLNITESQYFSIISKKTASLIQSACKIGAMTVSEDQQTIDKMSEYGYHLGLAFQIKDDLLDIGDTQTGKSKGNDIKEHKLTLPLIYTINTLPSVKRIALKSQLRLMNKNPKTISHIIETIKQTGGIDYANKKMQEHIHQAQESLRDFSDSIYKKYLIELLVYIANRER